MEAIEQTVYPVLDRLWDAADGLAHRHGPPLRVPPQGCGRTLPRLVDGRHQRHVDWCCRPPTFRPLTQCHGRQPDLPVHAPPPQTRQRPEPFPREGRTAAPPRHSEGRQLRPAHPICPLPAETRRRIRSAKEHAAAGTLAGKIARVDRVGNVSNRSTEAPLIDTGHELREDHGTGYVMPRRVSTERAVGRVDAESRDAPAQLGSGPATPPS